jgi:hypothetical protein
LEVPTELFDVAFKRAFIPQEYLKIITFEHLNALVQVSSFFAASSATKQSYDGILRASLYSKTFYGRNLFRGAVN